MLTARTQVLLDGVRLNNSTYRTGPVQYLYLNRAHARGPDRGAAGTGVRALRVGRHGRRDPGHAPRFPGGRGANAQPFSGYDQWSSLVGFEHRVREGPVRGLTVTARYWMSRMKDVGRTDSLETARKLQMYDNEDRSGIWAPGTNVVVALDLDV